MKAIPPLPTSSPADVLRLGGQQMAAAKNGQMHGAAPVCIDLRMESAPTGLPMLVDATTGECAGIFASTAVAERSRNFFK